jgi:hypothetical protein
MRTLLLVRANKSGGSVRWSDDDYDVREGERVIGRIMLRAEGLFSFRLPAWSIAKRAANHDPIQQLLCIRSESSAAPM